jgi:hypothetical protein
MACRKRGVEELGRPHQLLETREAEKYCHRKSPPDADGASSHA